MNLGFPLPPPFEMFTGPHNPPTFGDGVILFGAGMLLIFVLLVAIIKSIKK